MHRSAFVEELEEFAQLGVCNFQLPRQKFFLCILQDVAESVSLVLDFALFCFLLCVFFQFSSFIFLAMKIILVLLLPPKKLLQKCPLTFSQYESRDSQKSQPFFKFMAI
jgi:hypothetical protein